MLEFPSGFQNVLKFRYSCNSFSFLHYAAYDFRFCFPQGISEKLSSIKRALYAVRSEWETCALLWQAFSTGSSDSEKTKQTGFKRKLFECSGWTRRSSKEEMEQLRLMSPNHKSFLEDSWVCEETWVRTVECVGNLLKEISGLMLWSCSPSCEPSYLVCKAALLTSRQTKCAQFAKQWNEKLFQK